MNDVRHSKVYAIRYSNGWQHTASDESAAEARERDLPVIDFVPLTAYREAVEALRKAPHASHCEAGSPMWPGPCTCWKREWA